MSVFIKINNEMWFYISMSCITFFKLFDRWEKSSTPPCAA